MDNNIDFPITSIFVSQVCTYCCLDKDFIKECKKRTESLLETTNNNYFIKDSAFVTMELRKEMLNVLIERKNTKRCSEIGKIYIRKKLKINQPKQSNQMN